jgi:hypothetical protein
MSLLRKLGIEHIIKNQPVVEPRARKNVSRKQKILFYGIIAGSIFLLFGLWIFSLTSPAFDLTPTEFGTTEDIEQVKPIQNAFQNVGGIFEQ